MSERPTFTPCVFYKDPLAALKWLEQAFGFETTLLVTDDQGNLGHSEMVFENGVISVAGEWSDPQLGGAEMRSPANLGGAGTQFVRISLPDGIDAHCERARAAGAKITAGPSDQFYGDRTYRAMDPEGHIWNFSQPVRAVSNDEMEQASGLRISTSLEGAGS